ncbi:GNAT family N-acetyltransferase [Tissierella sp.]|uniref:GNAT family N-acetyltransferase n=1 Tax=Tissierella sp. TaxID=41274 RepID=UPI0028560767|nr:GNAT family N-acetyltransferase [Tissierella sp.]MDR7857842.1 GNAT family N-acetyltransferase [Tissierella sp.]
MLKVDNSNTINNYNVITYEECPSFSGIVEGECKGDLWVDDIEDPHIAIVNSYAVGSFAFLGNIINDDEYMKLYNYTRNDIFNFLKQKEVSCFEFSIESDNLKPYILKMFEDKIIESETEYSFRKTEGISINYSLPDGFHIQKVDYEFWEEINRGHYKNADLITTRLLESWGSFDNFIAKSIAFCIVYSESIVSVILGTGRFRNIIPIDIETDDDFTHRGFGYYLTVEFVNECINKGLIPQWDCVESNPISKRLAEKAEFEFLRENKVYWFDI